jgi:cyclopropane-fatty-acyl-phospholipid synthase
MLPDGRIRVFQGREPGPEATLHISDLRCLRRVAGSGDLGFAEGYLRGEWNTPDLATLLQLLGLNRSSLGRLPRPHPAVRMLNLVRRGFQRNTRAGAKRNIHAHYDLGNDFYAAWLDPTMTYSGALFAPEDTDLATAQLRKYRELAQAVGVEPGHHVLEIGCGWGGFAEFAAREIGCRVTAITISRQQFDGARKRIQSAGLTDRVGIKLLDYRDVRGVYDRVVSIEMVEAVGEAFWPTFFQRLEARLGNGGRAGLQVITVADERFEAYRRKTDFIQRYVFPGGMLPSRRVLRDFGKAFAMPVVSERAFGSDYALTLALWRDRFQLAWPSLAHGFDERFRRLWEYYFAYCEAGFRIGTIDVRQMVFAKS